MHTLSIYGTSGKVPGIRDVKNSKTQGPRKDQSTLENLDIEMNNYNQICKWQFYNQIWSGLKTKMKKQPILTGNVRESD